MFFHYWLHRLNRCSRCSTKTKFLPFLRPPMESVSLLWAQKPDLHHKSNIENILVLRMIFKSTYLLVRNVVSLEMYAFSINWIGCFIRSVLKFFFFLTNILMHFDTTASPSFLPLIFPASSSCCRKFTRAVFLVRSRVVLPGKLFLVSTYQRVTFPERCAAFGEPIV